MSLTASECVEKTTVNKALGAKGTWFRIQAAEAYNSDAMFALDQRLGSHRRVGHED